MVQEHEMKLTLEQMININMLTTEMQNLHRTEHESNNTNINKTDFTIYYKRLLLRYNQQKSRMIFSPGKTSNYCTISTSNPQ